MCVLEIDTLNRKQMLCCGNHNTNYEEKLSTSQVQSFAQHKIVSLITTTVFYSLEFSKVV